MNNNENYKWGPEYQNFAPGYNCPPTQPQGAPGSQCKATNPQGIPGGRCFPVQPPGSPGFQVPNGGTNNGSNQKPPKTKKLKRKKKHGFLKFLLIVILLILAYNGVKWGSNKYAQSSFDKFMIDYPFASFENESDNPQYITGNFSLYDYEEIAGEDVEWKSSNTGVLKIADDGSVTVTRPEDKSKNVTITGVYKKLLGKGYQTYEVTVISSNTQAPEDFVVITKEDLQNDVYNRNMEATLDESGNITSMYGDFKNTYIYTAEDGLAWIEAYKGTLGIDSKIQFQYHNSTESKNIKTFSYIANNNGIKDSSKSIVLSVNKETFELFNVNCEIDNRTSIVDTNVKEDWDYKSIILKYTQDNQLDYGDVIVNAEEKLIYKHDGKDCVVMSVVCVFEKANIHIAYIDMLSGQVLVLESQERLLTGTGKNEFGKKVDFPIENYKIASGVYYMADEKRNIHVYNQLGWYPFLKNTNDDSNVFMHLFSLGEYFFNELLEFRVVSTSKTFDDPVAVGSYKNLIKAYDWYKNELGIVSYDGKGSKLILNVNAEDATDNAAWGNFTKEITVNPAELLKYTCGSRTEVLGHEYTHGIFQNTTSNIGISEDNPCIGAMNEAYADIFGCLIAGLEDWKVGKNIYLEDGSEVCFRDIANFNSKGVLNTKINGLQYPTEWHGENWHDEEHIASVVLSHVAWEMYNDKSFSNSDIANIWYDALILGYTCDSDFVSVRRNVIRAMDNSGYSKKLQDKVAVWFDEVAIHDDQYVLTTTDSSVKGDIVLDNTTERRYVMIASILGSAFGDTPIYIYEEVDKPNKAEQQRINKMIQDYVDAEAGEVTNIRGEKVKIQYEQVQHWKIDILEKFVSNSRTELSDIMTGAVGEDLDEESQGILDTILDMCLICVVQESTPYEFYEGMGINMDAQVTE